MIDSHFHPGNWGIRPVLFNIGKIQIPSYSFFVFLALIAGTLFYAIDSRKKRVLNDNTFYIFLAALIGGTLGAKLPIWIANYKLIIASLPNIGPLLSGRTIVGGLIGGTLSVILTKKFLGIKDKRGNQFAPAIALGIAIGRIGCLLRGCCYGKATGLPWGVNFGDGIFRHPTQIYEMIFNLGMFVYLLAIREKVTEPGKLFRIFMNAYFSFRFLLEFIRVEKVVFLGLTGFQLACLMALAYINRGAFMSRFKGLQIEKS